MPNRHMSRQLGQHIVGKDLRHQPHALDVVHLAAHPPKRFPPTPARDAATNTVPSTSAAPHRDGYKSPSRRTLRAAYRTAYRPLRRRRLSPHSDLSFRSAAEESAVTTLARHQLVLQQKLAHAVTTSSANCDSSARLHGSFRSPQRRLNQRNLARKDLHSLRNRLAQIERPDISRLIEQRANLFRSPRPRRSPAPRSHSPRTVRSHTPPPISAPSDRLHSNVVLRSRTWPAPPPSRRPQYPCRVIKPRSASSTSALCSAASSFRSSHGGAPHSAPYFDFAYSELPNSRCCVAGSLQRSIAAATPCPQRC